MADLSKLRSSLRLDPLASEQQIIDIAARTISAHSTGDAPSQQDMAQWESQDKRFVESQLAK